MSVLSLTNKIHPGKRFSLSAHQFLHLQKENYQAQPPDLHEFTENLIKVAGIISDIY